MQLIPVMNQPLRTRWLAVLLVALLLSPANSAGLRDSEHHPQTRMEEKRPAVRKAIHLALVPQKTTPRVTLPQCAGPYVADPSKAPPGGPNPNCRICGRGEPVDTSTGLFSHVKTDLFVDDVLPIHLTRTYRQGDPISRAFGVGTSQFYDMFLAGDNTNWTYIDLILPDGGRIHYPRITAGTDYPSAVFEHDAAPAMYFKSQIAWNSGWILTLRDGTSYHFRSDNLPGDYRTTSLVQIADRYGNAITIMRGDSVATLNPKQILSANGRHIDLTYDSQNRIVQAQDGLGRTVSYTYDSGGRLATVTGAGGSMTQYTYDSNNRMVSITDNRGILYLTNQYDGNSRVSQQTLANGGVYQFAYTLDGNGNVTQTNVTYPSGTVETMQFDTTGYFSGGDLITDTPVTGKTYAYQYQAGTGLPQSVTDPLGRQTRYTYDGKGNLLTRTISPGGITTTYTYDPLFSQVASLTDPVGNTTTFTLDGAGNTTQVQDPTGTVSYTYNSSGQKLTAATSAGTTQYGYTAGFLTSIIDPGGQTWQSTVDIVGRVTATTDPLGGTIRYQYDNANDIVSVTDPTGTMTTFGYDANSNLTSIRDAGGGVTSYVYDNMNHRSSRTDPLGHSESYAYDPMGNLKTFTDRKGQGRTYGYDALNRLTGVAYADSSVTNVYDDGNRLTSIIDSLGGTINFTYDVLNDLTSENGLQGTIAHTYDNAGRRLSTSVSGGASIGYGYDAGGRVTQISQQGMPSVGIVYDTAGRRTSLTLPNGVVVAYQYDSASHLTGMTYTSGGALLGSLTYGYDAAGRRTSMGGSLAQTGLPNALTAASYNTANQATQWGAISLTYDLNGNLASDGVNTYTWDARNRLTGISGGYSGTYQYDALGRRSLNPSGTRYLYDGLNPIAEFSGTSSVTQFLSGPGLDEMLSRTDGGGTQSYLADGSGSTVALSDFTGTIQTQYSYQAYGATASTGGSSPNQFEFTGREADSSGLYYYRARYYSPVLQRFLSEDPQGYSGGDTNLYSYGFASPTMFVDPLGQSGQGLWGAAMAFRQRIVNFNTRYSAAIGVTLNMAMGGIGAVFELAGGAAAAEDAAKPFAMGLDAELDAFAQTRDATTWKQFPNPENWRSGVLDKLADPNTPVHFNLNGVDVWGGVQRAASGAGGATDWELLQLRQNPQFWDSTTFWKNGQVAPNPFK